VSARLVDPVLGEFALDRSNGFVAVKVDPGWPAARAVVDDLVNASGTYDGTQVHGARSVSVQALLLPTVNGPTRRAILARLGAYCAPQRRPVLLYDEEGDGTYRRIALRGSQLGAPREGKLGRSVQAAWEAPTGLIESAELHTQAVLAAPQRSPGRTYPKTFNWVFPSVNSAGAVGVLNEGTENVAPVYRLWGPCTTPRITNVETAARMVFPGLQLLAGQFVEVDVRNSTVRFMGDVGQNYFGRLDVPNSTFTWLAPGSNRINYTPDSYDGTTHADVIWRDAWLA